MAGCVDCCVPESGAAGFDTGFSNVLMLEESAARVFTALVHPPGSQSNSAVLKHAAAVAEAQKEENDCGALATGETLAHLLTEPAAGSDAAGIQARAGRAEIATELNERNLGDNGGVAGVLLVFRRVWRQRVACEGLQESLVEGRDFAGFSARGGMRTRWAACTVVAVGGDFG